MRYLPTIAVVAVLFSHGLQARGAPGGIPAAAARPADAPAAVPVARETAPGPETVTLGVYMNRIPELDLKSNTFLADFYVWFLWKGDIDPTQTFELSNAVELANLVKTPIYADATGAAVADTLKDGSRYQIFRVHGHFGNAFQVNSYPFDEQDVTIEVEDSKHGVDELSYLVDSGATGVNPRLELPGWKVTNAGAEVSRANFETNFGDPRVKKGEDAYSHFRFRMHVRRPELSLLAKTFVPIAIVVVITLLAFLVEPDEVEARLGLEITALMSAVALQFTAASELPAVSYLVLLDKIYLLAYFTILLAVLLAIRGQNLFGGGHVEEAHRSDRLALRGLVLLFFTGASVLFIFR